MSSEHRKKETEMVERELKAARLSEEARSKKKSVQMPSTERVERALEKGEQKLESLQRSDHTQMMGTKGQQVVEDVKRLLEDHKTLVHKNEGDLLQNIVRHGQVLMHSLSEDPALQGLFTNWQNITQSIMSGNDAEGLVASGGELLKSLKNTEEFMDLVSELISMLQTFVAEKSEQIIEGESIMRASHAHQAEKDKEREKIIENLRATLSNLSSNYVWCDMVQRGRLLARKGEVVGEKTEEVSRTALEIVWEADNTRCLIADIRTLLHRIAGETVDIDAFCEHLSAAWDDVTRNNALSSVVYELGEHMRQIAEDPSLAEDQSTKNELKELLSRAEAELRDLQSNPAVLRAKEESRALIHAIKNEPTSRKIIDDSVKLWNDIKSDKPGVFVDPQLVSQLRHAVVPMLLAHLENVPIPAVRGFGEFLGKYDYTVENIHLSVPELLPENIRLKFEYEMDASPLKLEASNQRMFLYLEISDMQIRLRDVNWTFARHSIPRIHDSGRLDADTLGHGLSIAVKAEFKAAENEFVVLDAACVIDKWSVRVTESNHNFIYEALSLLFAHQIKHQVQQSVEAQLRSLGEFANGQLHALLHEVKEKTKKVSAAVEIKKTTAKAAAKGILGKQTLNKTQAIEDEGKFQEAKAEVKTEVKRGGKSIFLLAAEKASQYLTRQQDKLQQAKTKPIHKPSPYPIPSISITPPPSETEKSASPTPSTSTTTTTVPTSTALPTPPYNVGNSLALSLDSNFDELSVSQSIPPTPPSSPINPLHAANQGINLSDSSFVPESLRDVPASMRAEEIRGDVSDEAQSPLGYSSSEDVSDQESSVPAPVEAWVPTGVMPSLGFEIYPDVPSISGDASEVKSTASNYGDDENVSASKPSLEKETNNTLPRVVNEQGTSAF